MFAAVSAGYLNSIACLIGGYLWFHWPLSRKNYIAAPSVASLRQSYGVSNHDGGYLQHRTRMCAGLRWPPKKKEDDMRKSAILTLFLGFAGFAVAQVSNPSIISVTTAPTGSCSAGFPNRQVISTGILYSCQGGTWAAAAGSVSGTVGSGTANSLTCYPSTGTAVGACTGITTDGNGNLTVGTQAPAIDAGSNVTGNTLLGSTLGPVAVGYHLPTFFSPAGVQYSVQYNSGFTQDTMQVGYNLGNHIYSPQSLSEPQLYWGFEANWTSSLQYLNVPTMESYLRMYKAGDTSGSFAFEPYGSHWSRLPGEESILDTYVRGDRIWLRDSAARNLAEFSFADQVADGGTYSSGITATGSTGQTCYLSSFNGGGSGAYAVIALTGTNTIATGTKFGVANAGSGYTSAPTTATASSGTATCSGTATISSSLLAGPTWYAPVIFTYGFSVPYQTYFGNSTTPFNMALWDGHGTYMNLYSPSSLTTALVGFSGADLTLLLANNSTGNFNEKVQGTIQSTAVAFANLPACASGLEGTMRAVTDSATATWGATITGSSTNHVLAYCDGTAWTVAAK